ncbi:MAG: hypothetical protein CM15mP112_03610 [Flavobacteriales bacterium]|nr:MAG: hypothetical protein CM15mP112_03610 [Flavobacteriales bacterium]
MVQTSVTFIIVIDQKINLIFKISHNSINSNIKTGNVNNKFCQSQSNIDVGYKKVLSKQILYANFQYRRNISSSMEIIFQSL